MVIPYRLEIPILFYLVFDMTVNIESTHNIVANQINQEKYFSFGYLISTGDIVLFSHIDNFLDTGVDLDNKVISNYTSMDYYVIKNRMFRNVNYDGKAKYLNT